MTVRHLYLARHGDAAEGGGLTAAGQQQAECLARRLADVPLTSITHSPERRAVETAALLSGPAAVESEAVGDYVPYVPDPVPSAFAALIADWTAEELASGPRLAAQALDRFAGPAPDGAERHDLVITHAYPAAWFVRDALQAPPERWLGLNHANCALTVIRYSDDRPPGLLVFNDMSHLPAELRWTGFPPHLRLSR
ncbi:histidine phosphatase family protein [Actinoplanes sp. NPDC049316]|uniref:histidine phosphatase family protein n=1 Tax=Actinoplanes sp. NPDC049316 TaxID=3154727 RepID=UPI003426C484